MVLQEQAQEQEQEQALARVQAQLLVMPGDEGKQQLPREWGQAGQMEASWLGAEEKGQEPAQGLGSMDWVQQSRTFDTSI